MSRWHYIVADTGGKFPAHVAELGSIFGGVYPVLEAAIGIENFLSLSGQTCEDVYETVKQGVINFSMPEMKDKLLDDAAQYNEERLEVARKFLTNMLYQMWLNPKAKLDFSE